MSGLVKSEVIKKLGVCERTLDNMVYGGKFPPGVRIGKCDKWLEEVVDAWLDSKFAGQRAWLRQAAGAPAEQGAASTPAQPDQKGSTPRAKPAASRDGAKFSTALKSAGVPAPVRLV